MFKALGLQKSVGVSRVPDMRGLRLMISFKGIYKGTFKGSIGFYGLGFRV